jgi:hypothetical protein
MANGRGLAAVALRLLLAAVAGGAAVGCRAFVPKGAPLQNCIHICNGNKACEWQCREDAGEVDETPLGMRARGSSGAPAAPAAPGFEPDDGGESIAPPPAR